MKKDFTSLPQQKQAELQKVVTIIQDKCSDVEMIILFGSYARGDYKEAANLSPDRKSGHVSDYDILVVPQAKKTALKSQLWREITESCHEKGIKTSVRIVARDITDLNIQLTEDQYFFRAIKQEGIILFDSNNFELADKKELQPEKKQHIAQNHFKNWFKSATEFYEHYTFSIDKKYFNKAAFMLHQTAEVCYKTVLLVFANNCPHEHYLYELRSLARKQFSPLDSILRYRPGEEDRLFKLLDYAYIGARYDPDYRIKPEELEILAIEVKKLLEITKEACEWHIEKMG